MSVFDRCPSVCVENILKDSSLSYLHDVIHFLENTPDELLFPRKYKTALKHTVSQKVAFIFNENSTLPVNKMVADVIACLPESLSSKLILEMTSFAIKEWEAMCYPKFNQLPTV